MDLTKEKKQAAQALIKSVAPLIRVIANDPDAIDNGDIRKMICSCSRALEAAGMWKSKSVLDLKRMQLHMDEWKIEIDPK